MTLSNRRTAPNIRWRYDIAVTRCSVDLSTLTVCNVRSVYRQSAIYELVCSSLYQRGSSASIDSPETVQIIKIRLDEAVYAASSSLLLALSWNSMGLTPTPTRTLGMRLSCNLVNVYTIA